MPRFFSAVILIFLALYFQFLLGEVLGVWINFALGVLVAAAFFLPLAELIPLTLIFLLVINWRRAPSPELLVFAVPPIASFFVKDFFSWHRLVTFSALFFFSVAFLYLVFAPQTIISESRVFFADLILGFTFGAVSFKILDVLSEE